MLMPITETTRSFTGFINKGLNHPSFLGRFISFGILYGGLYLIIPKIYSVFEPSITKLLKELNLNPKAITGRKVKKKNSTEIHVELNTIEKVIKVVKQVVCQECHKLICEKIEKKPLHLEIQEQTPNPDFTEL